MSVSTRAVEPHRPRALLKRLGAGLITGASDDDPSGIGTYSRNRIKLTSMKAAALCSAKGSPCQSASAPQTQEPRAMPPKVIAWYMERQRPRISSGDRICIDTLTVVRPATAPAEISVAIQVWP